MNTPEIVLGAMRILPNPVLTRTDDGWWHLTFTHSGPEVKGLQINMPATDDAQWSFDGATLHDLADQIEIGGFL